MGAFPRLGEDLSRFQHPAIFEYDVCFVGWISSTLAEMVVNVIENAPGLTSYIRRRDVFFDFVTEPDRRKERLEYIRAMQKSRLSLCPANEPGTIRRRFWEALSMGRIPVLIDDKAELYHQDTLDWPSVCLHIPEDRILQLPEILKDYIEKVNDLGLRFRGLLARQVWEITHENCCSDSGL